MAPLASGRMAETLVVTDLDGTLWNHEARCHQRTLEALGELSAAGVPVLAATGRRLTGTRLGFEGNGLTLPAVCLNGALGWDFETERAFHTETFEPSALRAVFEVLESHGLSPCIYTDDGMVHAASPTTHDRHVESLGDELVRIASTWHLPPERLVLCLSMLGVDEELLAPAAAALASNQHGKLDLYPDHLFGGWSIMVQPPGISKWQGVEAWCAHAGLQPTRIIALGDGGNDLELLANADVALAVEGGDSRALALGDALIPGPDQAGWAQVLDHI